MGSQSLRDRWPWLVAVLIVLVFLARVVDIRVDGDPRPVGGADDIAALAERDDLNVLFILIDTLRADRLGSWGYARDTSPTLDRLAATGVRFARHLSQSSWTKCSLASLWTGLYPARAGVTRFDHVTSSEAVMPAELFQEAGYRTAGIYRNGWVAPNFGFAQGFEVYHKPKPRPLLAAEKRANPTLSIEGTDVSATEAAIAFLRAYRSERWFLYLHLMDVHEYVYDDASAIFGNTYSDVYDQSILRLNRVLEQLVQFVWKDRELAARTLIIVASDHGEAFRERGFEGHARNVYPEVTEVPLILSLPFRLEPGVVIQERTQNVDLWPTVLEMVGQPPLEPADGRSLLPQILAVARGEPEPDASPAIAIAHLDRSWGQKQREPMPQVGVAFGDHRFVLTTGPESRDELFDRRGDHFETRNVLGAHPELARQLREVARDYLQAEPPWQDQVPTVELDEMEINQLRALGYSVP
jgi:arylsulfatase A-like enzyme